HPHQLAVENGQCQRPRDKESAAVATLGVHLAAAAYLFDVATHHVHAHPAARHVGDDVGGGEAGQEDEIVDIGLGQFGIGADQLFLQGLFQDLFGIEAGAIVGYTDHHAAALVRSAQVDD